MRKPECMVRLSVGRPPRGKRVVRLIKYTNGPLEAQILDGGKQGYLTDYFNFNPQVFYLSSLDFLVLFLIRVKTVNHGY